MRTLTLRDLASGLAIPDWVLDFRHAPGTRVVFGPGQLSRLGELAKEFGQRAFLVTDRGIAKVGYLDKALASLRDAGLSCVCYSEVRANPTTEDVARCVEIADGAELIIGLGGGSSMDAAKGCNFILTNGGEMKDYWGKDKATKPMLPLIAVPTTAGTGSECQSYALIADAKTHQKMACGDKKAAAKIALLDPELTLSQPPSVTANTGVDAITHALESLVTKAWNETSVAYSRAAFAMLAKGFGKVLSDPSSLFDRALMQLGAALAGAAIENSMLGAAHSAANPLTAHFDVVHGQAVGVMLPAIIRRNRADADARAAYESLGLGEPLDEWLTARLRAAGLKTRLRELSVTRESVRGLAKEAAEQWTAKFNPVRLSEADFQEAYLESW